MNAKSLKKAEFLSHWRSIPQDQKVKPSPVPYKHEGSTYCEDSIRITGSKEFIDSVLSRIKDILQYENGSTRLQTVYKETIDRESGLPSSEVSLEAWNCYIQVHERGSQAIAINAFLESLSAN